MSMPFRSSTIPIWSALWALLLIGKPLRRSLPANSTWKMEDTRKRPRRLFKLLSAAYRWPMLVATEGQPRAHRPSIPRQCWTLTKVLPRRAITQAVRKRISPRRLTARHMQYTVRFYPYLLRRITQSLPEGSLRSAQSKPRCMRTMSSLTMAPLTSMGQSTNNNPSIRMLRSHTLITDSMDSSVKRSAGPRVKTHDTTGL